MLFSNKFMDSAGRNWTCELGLAVEDRMKELSGYTLDDLAPKIGEKQRPTPEQIGPISDFCGDFRKQFEVFYAMVKPTADKRGMTRDQVRAEFSDTASLMAMSQAVLRAIHDFFRFQPERIWFIRLIATKCEEIATQTGLKMQGALDKIDIGKTLDAGLATVVEQKPEPIAPSSPAASAPAAITSPGT